MEPLAVNYMWWQNCEHNEQDCVYVVVKNGIQVKIILT